MKFGLATECFRYCTLGYFRNIRTTYFLVYHSAWRKHSFFYSSAPVLIVCSVLIADIIPLLAGVLLIIWKSEKSMGFSIHILWITVAVSRFRNRSGMPILDHEKLLISFYICTAAVRNNYTMKTDLLSEWISSFTLVSFFYPNRHLLVLTQLMLTLGIPYIAIYIQFLDPYTTLIVVPVAMALTAVLMFLLVAVIDEVSWPPR